jgi:signal peptidase II
MSEQAAAVGRSGWRWLLLSLLTVAADQLVKGWIVRHFALYESLTVLPVFDIMRAHNEGAAFSFLAGAGGWQRWAFTLLALVVSVVLVYWLRTLDGQRQRLQCAGLALIVGGALGNMIDRVRHGYVVDFIVVHWRSWEFPAFNVADSAITIGAGLLILDALLDWRRGRVT